jgi:flagellar basal-body rod protein FlgF/flagellar basal-body rod protein FlgG
LPIPRAASGKIGRSFFASLLHFANSFSLNVALASYNPLIWPTACIFIFDMNTGFYSSYAAFATRLDELEVVANNLANVNTNGFKSQRSFYGSFSAALTPEGPAPAMMTVSQAVHLAATQFGMLGGTRLDLSQGTLQATANDTDVALEGPGFFAVQTPNGVRYTRDGSFHLDKDRNLITQQGDKVLAAQPNQNLQPIQIPSGKITISPDGSISVDSTLVAKLRIDDFPPNTKLQPEGNSYLSAPGGAGKPASATVRQGSLETSNSDAIRSTVALIDLERTSQMIEKALSIFHNEFNRAAVQDLPRV